MPDALRRVTPTRYVAPLREGGSLPGLVEADDDGLYVVKFRGAGQGPGALVAEVLAGLAAAGPIAAADERLAERAAAALHNAAAVVPDGWLGADPAARRADLVAFLEGRLQEPRPFVEEAERARA